MTYTSPIVQFGAVTFSGSDIKSAIVTEEFDPLSITLPITTLELQLYSQDADFSLINPTGDYASLQYRQPLAIYETVGSTNKLIGQFYLDTWENTSDTLIKFNCVDLLGILDALTYDGGIWLTAINAGDLIDSLCSAVGAGYELDPDLYAFQLTGWLPICSYREALQQIAFAIGATVTCTRQTGLKIGKVNSSGAISKGIRCGIPHAGQSRMRAQRWRSGVWAGVMPDIPITKAEKGSSQSLTLRTQVTGVEITAHDINPGTGSLELYNGTLAAGAHKITFSQPIHDLTVTGATITSSGANYALLNVASGGTVVLSGLVYVDTAKVTGVYNGSLPAGTKTNVLTVTNATLVNSGNVAAITQRVYDYYQNRLWQQVKLYAPVAQTSGVAIIDTLYNQQIRGIVEKMTLDLGLGFTAQTDIIGVLYP